MNGSRAAGLTLAWRFAAFRSEGFPLLPTLILLTLALVAIFANVITPYNPEIGSLGDRFHPPVWQAGGSAEHLLGTDHLGRDVLSRLIFGAPVSMVVGFTAVHLPGLLRARPRGGARGPGRGGGSSLLRGHRHLAAPAPPTL